MLDGFSHSYVCVPLMDVGVHWVAVSCVCWCFLCMLTWRHRMPSLQCRHTSVLQAGFYLQTSAAWPSPQLCMKIVMTTVVSCDETNS